MAPFRINIPIKAGTHYIQILPRDLLDCTFTIQGQELPKFISKLPGKAEHFIGKITYTSKEADCKRALDNFIKNGFIDALGKEKALTPKCWFIKALDLVVGAQNIMLRIL